MADRKRTPVTPVKTESHTIVYAGTVCLLVDGAWRPTLAQLDEFVQAASDAGADLGAKVEVEDKFTQHVYGRLLVEPTKTFRLSVNIPVGPDAA